jgi:arylsulfatase A-like enzyme
MDPRRVGGPRTLLFLASLTFACCGTPAPTARNLVLISVDTLGADHLGCYGHERDTSPRIDRFAEGGVLVEEALTTSPWTLPAHASLLTGRYPSRHGVVSVERALAVETPTLAGLLSGKEFETVAIVNSAYLAPQFGLARGFETYLQVRENQSADGAAPEITDLALGWLRTRKQDRRFFLFIHYYDIHSDYRSRPEYEAMFVGAGGRFDGTTQQILEAEEVPLAEAEHLSRLYDAGVRQLDDELQRLFDGLSEDGRLLDTVVVITSDHGEEFMEHGGVLHGETHYQEMLRVPLIFRGAGIPSGVRLPGPVSLVDLFPTVLDLLGVPIPDADGLSLRERWESPGGLFDRPVYSEASRVADRSAIRHGRYKLIVDRDTRTRELYDLVEDPRERVNVESARADALEPLLDALERFTAVRREAAPAPELDPELEERLRALGYVGP